MNAVRCLRLLKRSDVFSRADLARELSATRTTVGNAVKSLLDAGLVWEPPNSEPDTARRGRSGRPSIGVALKGEGAYFVGLDVSTGSMTAVLLDLAMSVVARISRPIEGDSRDVKAVGAQLALLAKEAIGAAGPRGDRVRGVGVAVPGLIGRDGRVVVAPLLGWRGIDLKGLLAARLPEAETIRVCNDAVAVANAICATASPADVEDLLLVLMSEGIGSAWIRQGSVVEGANGFAGEIGQMIMAPTPGKDSMNLQALAGERLFAPFLPPGLPLIDAAAALAGREPDLALAAVLDSWADHLAAGFLNAIWMLDPARIVVSGALAPLYPRVAARVGSLLERGMNGLSPPPVGVSQYAGEAAAVGAAALIREAIFALPEFGEEAGT